VDTQIGGNIEIGLHSFYAITLSPQLMLIN